MIFTTEANKVVYVAKKDGKVMYVGRGSVSRAISLLEQSGHHIVGDFDQVEVLGPYTHEDSKLVEKDLVLQYHPELNDYLNPDKRTVRPRNSKRTTTRLPRANRGRPIGYGEKTQAILNDLSEGTLSQAQIARKYGVSRQHVNGLKKFFRKSAHSQLTFRRRLLISN